MAAEASQLQYESSFPRPLFFEPLLLHQQHAHSQPQLRGRSVSYGKIAPLNLPIRASRIEDLLKCHDLTVDSKLGSGSYARVYKATIQSEVVALKISNLQECEDDVNPAESVREEGHYLQLLGRLLPECNGIIKILDQFTLNEGLEKEQECLVLDLHGSNLNTARRDPKEEWNWSRVEKLLLSILTTLNDLSSIQIPHDSYGLKAGEYSLCHRDLKPSNILLQNPACPLSPEKKSTRALSALTQKMGRFHLKAPNRQPLSPILKERKTLPAPFTRACVITDLGSAILLSKREKHSFDIFDLSDSYKCTSWYRAPESWSDLFFNQMFDTWSAGCVFFFLLTGEHLFASTAKEDSKEQLIKILTDFSELLGRLPDSILDKVDVAFPLEKGFQRLCDYPEFSKKERVSRIEEYITYLNDGRVKDFTDENRTAFATLLERMIDPNPETRIHPDQALKLFQELFQSSLVAPEEDEEKRE